MRTLIICPLVLAALLACCAPRLAVSSPHHPVSPLDDTFGTVALDPDTAHVLPSTPVALTVHIDVTDARVFSLYFTFDPARFQFLSAVAGFDSSLHLMPPIVSGGNLELDGFFHPNFTGSIELATVNFYVHPVTEDDTAFICFSSGQGYSGTEGSPIPIQFSGDSAVVLIEGTPPNPPTELLITRLPYPAQADSVLLQWHPVSTDVNGDTVINPLYVIYLEHVMAAPGLFDSIGATSDTLFYDSTIIFNPDSGDVKNASTLHVVARKTQP